MKEGEKMTSLQKAQKKIKDLQIQNDNLKSQLKIQKESYEDKIEKMEKEFNKKFESIMSVVSNLENKVDKLEKENTELKQENMELKNRVEVLENENKTLKNDNIRLKAIINKDSSNSSIPPSKDDKPKKKNNKNNLREKSGKPNGGQKNHKGKTFTKKMVEELKEKDGVQTEVISHGDTTSKNYIVKYEIDTQTIVIIKEHRFYYNKRDELKIPLEFKADVRYGNDIKTLCSIMSVEEVISLERIEQFVNILTGGLLNISQGSLTNWIKELSHNCRSVVKKIKIAIKNSDIVHTDLTETKEAGNKRQVRVYGTQKYAAYIPSKDKKIIRVKHQWILDGFTGYIVHDHDTGLYNYGIKEMHVECNVHLRRYLKNNIELTNHSWSKEMDELLLEIKAEKEKLQSMNISEFSKEKLDEYSKKYDAILEKGQKEYEEDQKIQNSKYLKDEERPLLNRLKKYKQNHLLYANDFKVPFDNNMSERDLRPIKLKLKVSRRT